jgi:glucosamine--fructose-6-phosphate aminotransferase (isomerizing)
MCGIFGIFRHPDSKITAAAADEIFHQLANNSMSRGQDSSGIACIDPKEIKIFKAALPINRFMLKPPVQSTVRGLLRQGGFVFGHSRMETNGSFLESENNQPVISSDLVGVHNGIVVNVESLWKANPQLKRLATVDTEFILARIAELRKKSQSFGLAAQIALSEVQGSYTMAIAAVDAGTVVFATNTGSLYIATTEDKKFFCFASELTHLANAIEVQQSVPSSRLSVGHIEAGQIFELNLSNGEIITSLAPDAQSSNTRKLSVVDLSTVRDSGRTRFTNERWRNDIEILVRDGYQRAAHAAETARRCSRCVLPETMPYIEFDAQGVCNYCKRHQPRETRGTEALTKDLSSFRGKGKYADCIVSFSGGRDSSYALHYVVKELGLKPLAYSYDWGMLTDLGRRNQARMTGKLGVEHVLVSANIQAKRSYIRKNVTAWARRPHLGTVPLFMAGDKQYFYHLNRVQKKYQIPLVIYADNALEKTDFKYGFANIQIGSEVGKAHKIGFSNSLQLLAFYGKEYLFNSAYLNSSLVDTFGAYLSQYFTPKDYLYLFRYILWEEREIESALTGLYNWELAEDTKSSWRIGDGTQAFYNYIYFVGSALTEHDTFRSNQIRENAIGRPEALRDIIIGNQPRIDSLIWYFDTIGLDARPILNAVNQMPKRYT